MRFVRPVIAQNYLRGKSLGHRGFPSPRSNHSATESVEEQGRSVLEHIYGYVCGIGFGTGGGYLLMGTNGAMEQQEEQERKLRELEIEAGEKQLEQMWKLYEARRTR